MDIANLTPDELRTFEQYPGLEEKYHVSKVTRKKIVHTDYKQNYGILTCMNFFFVFSVIGWVWEVILYLVQDGILVNRGTLFGPWLPIYGVGGVIGILLIKRFADHHILTFCLFTGVCCTIEYFTSWFIEKTIGVRYWDYSGYFLNINGRICFEGALAFGLAGCAGIYILAPAVADFFKKIPRCHQVLIVCAMAVLFFVDVIYSHFHPRVGKGITEYISLIDNSLLRMH